MMYNQYPSPIFNQDYFLQQQTLLAQQQEWQRQQEMLAQQEWNEQQEHITKACHALSDFLNEANQIKPAYQLLATLEFWATLTGDNAGGTR